MNAENVLRGLGWVPGVLGEHGITEPLNGLWYVREEDGVLYHCELWEEHAAFLWQVYGSVYPSPGDANGVLFADLVSHLLAIARR